MRGPSRLLLSMLAALALAGCKRVEETPLSFPSPDRPVAKTVSSRWSTEEARDRMKEAEKVMDRSGVKPGMTVADIGAGEGYYTIRLAARVGEEGRVLAEDIFPDVRDKLAERVNRDRLDNVSVRLGEPADPKLPENSFDRIFMVHMYHEIGQPYEFLWRMRPSLKKGGRVVIVDADRPTEKHGTPVALLSCEFAAVGYKLVEKHPLPGVDAYIAQFEPIGDRPEPEQMRACRLKD